MQSMVKIHSLDNVAVALRDLAADETLMLDGTAIRLAQPVARGHKFALRPIAAGEAIIKYGLPIGHALETIASGVHIHSQNAKTNLSDLDSYQYQPQFPVLPPQAADREVQLYRRSSGEVGIRNELWIIPTVGCVNGIARQIQQRFLKETQDAQEIDGVHLFSHPFGCSQLGQDHENTRTMLQNMVRHPNAGAVLVIGLGCENNQVDVFRSTLGAVDDQRVRFMVCQQQDDEVEAGLEQLHALYQVMRDDRRQPGKLSELKFGLECGGSDGLSGITANPLLGRFFRLSDCQRRHDGSDRSAGDVWRRTDPDEPLPRSCDVRQDRQHGQRFQTVFYCS
jgi:altronate hydrolase